MQTYRYPVTVNDPKLTQRVLPSLRRAAGADRVIEHPLEMGSEDFPYYTENTRAFSSSSASRRAIRT